MFSPQIYLGVVFPNLFGRQSFYSLHHLGLIAVCVVEHFGLCE